MTLITSLALLLTAIHADSFYHHGAIPHQALGGAVLQYNVVDNFKQCARLCQYTSLCKSINWRPSTRLCELNSVVLPTLVTFTRGVIHVTVQEGNFAEDNACVPNSCADDQTCIPVTSSLSSLCVPTGQTLMSMTTDAHVATTSNAEINQTTTTETDQLPTITTETNPVTTNNVETNQTTTSETNPITTTEANPITTTVANAITTTVANPITTTVANPITTTVANPITTTEPYQTTTTGNQQTTITTTDVNVTTTTEPNQGTTNTSEANQTTISENQQTTTEVNSTTTIETNTDVSRTTTTQTTTTPRDCSELTDQFSEIQGYALNEWNQESHYGVTAAEDCLAMCLAASTFVCRSYEHSTYYSDCYLADVTRHDAPTASWLNFLEYTYYERLNVCQLQV